MKKLLPACLERGCAVPLVPRGFLALSLLNSRGRGGTMGGMHPSLLADCFKPLTGNRLQPGVGCHGGNRVGRRARAWPRGPKSRACPNIDRVDPNNRCRARDAIA